MALATTQVMGQGSPVNGRFASFSALNRGLARIPRISKITPVMPHFAADQLSPWQLTILDVVRCYPGRFTRSGLAKMLVGAKSWQDTSYAEYGRFSSQRRKDVDYLVDILLQQKHLQLDGNNRLIPVAPSDGVTQAP